MTKKKLKDVNPLTIAKIVFGFSGESEFWSMELGGYSHQFCFYGGDLIALILPILAQVESNHNPNAIGDNGAAIGILQIHAIMVKDVNRISGKAYTLQDRRDKAKSYEMATIYLRHYGKPNAEYLARCFNGGPRGNEKTATVKYWLKCQKVIKERRK